MNGAQRRYLYIDQKEDENGVMMTFSAAEPAGDGYDVVKIYFPQAEQAPENGMTFVFAPDGE